MDGAASLWEDGAGDRKVNSSLSGADVATGIIRWINADEVTDLIWSMGGLPETVTVEKKFCQAELAD